MPAICTVPPDTNGVFWTAPDREICIVSVVKEKINEEFEKDSGFEDPVGVMLPDPTPWNVTVIVMFTASDEPTRSELGFCEAVAATGQCITVNRLSEANTFVNTCSARSAIKRVDCVTALQLFDTEPARLHAAAVEDTRFLVNLSETWVFQRWITGLGIRSLGSKEFAPFIL